ncbi:2,3-bisphosphoglycerate-independent phosphoglycerate mutase [Patescibacteria group bacterium]|nr:2,3-bisphosphoglycerate-independent phosphoglycerate mutase [Patescibacteria group bacterium]
MTSNKKTNFVCVAVLDGWGISAPGPGNAITQANTPNMNKLYASFPNTQLEASGEAVGLPRGEAGNTETGHLNLGAGKIVYQDLARINLSIADGSFFTNEVILSAFSHAKNNNSSLHLMGLVGAGGVHSNLEHLFALIFLARKENFKNLYLHLFTDGRDSPPTASNAYINRIRETIKKEGVGTIASIMGRYWTMDRDRRWDRTAKAYFALTKGEGNLVKTPEEAIQMSYQIGKTDEFIEPSVITDNAGKPISLIKENDAVIFFNFRVDRPRQLSAAFLVDNFSDQSMDLEFDPYLEKYEKTHLLSKVEHYQKVFDRGEKIKNLYFATMTHYSDSLVKAGAKVIFSPEKIEIPLGRVISESGLKQLRLSESEKERFVTYYFNGLREQALPGEDRIIIPSPNVPTYDLKPEMSAYEITNKFIELIKSDPNYSFILINFANPDMVGHTGNIAPAIKAVEAVDDCIGKIANTTLAYNGTLLIIADHGNVEEMINSQSGQIDTEHSINPVPFIAVSNNYLGNPQNLQSGILADVAPTVLKLLNLEVPPDMTGRNLLDQIK